MSAKELPKFIQDLLTKVCKDCGFNDFSLQIKPGSQVGDGFASELLSIRIAENGCEKSLDIVAKLAPLNKNRQEGFFAKDVFEREIGFYEKVMPAFAKFQKEKNLSNEDQFMSYPKCYGTLADEENGHYVIILEDLRPQNFKLWSKAKPVPIENAKLSMRELGKLHGVSIAMKHQRSDEFAEFEQMRDSFSKFLESEHIVGMFEGSFDRAISLLKNEDHKNIIRDLKNKLKAYMESVVSDEVSNRFGVICHGDFWNNNILYRFNDKDVAEDIRILDWQMVRYISPAVDLVYNLFTSTDKALRDKEYDNLINIYYKSLSKTVQLLGSNADELFTFDDLQNELKICGNYALMMAPVLIEVSVAESSEISNLDDMFDKMKNEKGKLNLTSALSGKSQLIYEQRLSDVIGDIIAYGYYRKV